ncbi:hypothetical protein AURANDRAFT_67480 [Aureococcus anophagefferens]|uniref:AB hydrolase-1 domain-containing protein n=1 Tax=Aureococcus anophagefferens TaxID=44056 RepID=F0YLA7_AURAN|nr:hypothetical protein AURANDRAFT_67480 [Aureococcus anophagefferens]EGB04114.1 hypothetical protein AURANDRAFT_67480 [Aureococcus anophagefferens]|eukprot:XP_009041239.1 hypothetical protein AURANDRAFT_67480 [Aureococcus anophagefferens]
MNTVTAIAGMTSSRGRCHTFDRQADGYCRGEGCGAYLLALDSGNNALLGSAVGAAVGVLHGPTEGAELAFSVQCASLKSNIGHLEASAAAAGLASVLLTCLGTSGVTANAHLKRSLGCISVKRTLVLDCSCVVFCGACGTGWLFDTPTIESLAPHFMALCSVSYSKVKTIIEKTLRRYTASPIDMRDGLCKHFELNLNSRELDEIRTRLRLPGGSIWIIALNFAASRLALVTISKQLRSCNSKSKAANRRIWTQGGSLATDSQNVIANNYALSARLGPAHQKLFWVYVRTLITLSKTNSGDEHVKLERSVEHGDELLRDIGSTHVLEEYAGMVAPKYKNMMHRMDHALRQKDIELRSFRRLTILMTSMDGSTYCTTEPYQRGLAFSRGNVGRVDTGEVIPLLLFAHGGGYNRGIWTLVLRELQNNSHELVHCCEVIAFDWTSHGSSRQLSPVFDQNDWGKILAGDVRELLDDIGSIGRPTYGVGHGMGGTGFALAEIATPGTFDGILLLEPMIAQPQEPPTIAEKESLAAAIMSRRSNLDDCKSKREVADSLKASECQNWQDGTVEAYV